VRFRFDTVQHAIIINDFIFTLVYEFVVFKHILLEILVDMYLIRCIVLLKLSHCRVRPVKGPICPRAILFRLKNISFF
jgi:hypothetical protein